MSKPAAVDLAFDRIQAWCLDPEGSDLATQYREIFTRWNKADDLMDKYPNQKDAMTIYRMKFPDLSTAQVYRDFSNARRLFNNVRKHDKDFVRRWLINDIFKLIEAAKKLGPKGFKAWNMAHANLIKAARLDERDEEMLDPEILEQHNFFMIINTGGHPMKADFRRFLDMDQTTRKKLSDAFIAGPLTEDAAVEILENG